ncbi:MAG: MotA [Deltaproteobacteria bacterium]|nr:MAG: MotA [Deltaproteobacteria bacterium]
MVSQQFRKQLKWQKGFDWSGSADYQSQNPNRKRGSNTMISKKTSIIVLCLLLGWTGYASATDFDSVAGEVSRLHDQALSDQKQQDIDIDKERKQLLDKIEKLQRTVAKQEESLNAEKAEVASLAEERDRLQSEIGSRLATKEELDNIFLDHIRNFLSLVEKSPQASQKDQLLGTLKSYLEGERIFSLEDLKSLIGMYFDDIKSGAENVRYTAKILDRRGEEQEADIISLGHIEALFTADKDNGFLLSSPGSGRLIMSADPGFFTSREIAAFFNGDKTTAPLDISGGVAINQLSRKETVKDRLKSGGVLVIPILLVGLIAIIIVLERVTFLSRVRSNTDALMTEVTHLVSEGNYKKALETTRPHRNRPTGKVLMVGLVHKGETPEVIEIAMSEALLSQMPRLERFLVTLKVLAAVAPLLGLLGTVTGMINTFQVITIHGTGDPRLMAGGISEAMVTTQVGLAVAIPIMMAASFLGTRVKNLARDMEEKGIALMGALLKHKCER